MVTTKSTRRTPSTRSKRSTSRGRSKSRDTASIGEEKSKTLDKSKDIQDIKSPIDTSKTETVARKRPGRKPKELSSSQELVRIPSVRTPRTPRTPKTQGIVIERDQRFMNLNPGNVTPLYTNYVSPICDYISSYLPTWLTPDQLTLFGLFCATMAFFCVLCSGVRQEYLLYAAFFWFLYGLLDNLDGKQARRLKMCTAGGDFLDHSCDSLSCSFAALIFIHLLIGNTFISNQSFDYLDFGYISSFLPTCIQKILPDSIITFRTFSAINIQSYLKPWMLICLAQGPFFLASWAHPIIGRIMLSATIDGTTDYISVDEYNLFFLPMGLIISYFFPSLTSLPTSYVWNSICPEYLQNAALYPKYLVDFVSTIGAYINGIFQSIQIKPQANISIGLVLLVAACLFSLKNIIRVIWILLRREHLARFLPGVAFFTIVSYFCPPIVVEVFFFSFLNLEMIAARLKLHSRSLLYMWLPLASLVMVSWIWNIYAPIRFTNIICRYTTVGLCELFTSKYGIQIHHILGIILSISWIGCLLVYKNIINHRNLKP